MIPPSTTPATTANQTAGPAVAGATLAFTRQLTGEASFGYGARAYDDPRLRNFGGPLVDASLIWSATPLTTVTAKAQTTLDDSVVAGASGAMTRTYSLDVAHELTRAFTLGATASWTGDDYVGVAQRDSTTTLRPARRIPPLARAGAQGERQPPALRF